MVLFAPCATANFIISLAYANDASIARRGLNESFFAELLNRRHRDSI